MGSALATALREAGIEVAGPLRRGERCPQPTDCILLCVGDAEIAQAAADVTPGPLVGHVSGATTLAPLAPHEAFSLHPLMTVRARTGEGAASGTVFTDAGAAVAGSTERALATARALAGSLGMRPFEVADEDRAAYHAAASMA